MRFILTVLAVCFLIGCDSAGDPVEAFAVANESDRPVVVLLVSETILPAIDPAEAIPSENFDAVAIRVGDVSAQLVTGDYRDGETLRILVYARPDEPSPRIVERYGPGAAESGTYQTVTARDLRRDGGRIVVR